MDHFMLDGVKALFKFTIAILHLAFQVSPPSSNDVIGTIRNVARDLTDLKLLLSLVKRIKLPNSTYFAVKRSFYMIQSSFNSDLFYLQSLSIESRRQFDPSRALSVQPQLKTKVPAKSLINSPLSQFNPDTPLSGQPAQQQHQQQQHHLGRTNNLASLCSTGSLSLAPRVCCSADKTKICIQNLGQKGRSHLRLINAEVRTQERALMSPLRNCLVIGLSNCGKQIIVARQSSRRNFKLFREQDLIFHVHELQAEIFDGFYLETQRLAFIISHSGEVIKITYKDNQTYHQKQRQLQLQIQQQIEKTNSNQHQQAAVDQQQTISANAYSFMTETLLLRDCQSSSQAGTSAINNTIDHGLLTMDKIKLKLTSFDPITNLLWIYLECEQQMTYNSGNFQDVANGSNKMLNYTDLVDDDVNNNNDYGDESSNTDYLGSSLKESLNQIARGRNEHSGDTLNHQNPFSKPSSPVPPTIPPRRTQYNHLDRKQIPNSSENEQSAIEEEAEFNQQPIREPIKSELKSAMTTTTIGNHNNSNNNNQSLNRNNAIVTTTTCARSRNLRKILIIDTQTFDIFSSFTLHQNMGPILSMRTCLVAFCHFSNPMSSQFSSRIIKIEPTGHYEHLLSFSDVVDFMITIQENSQRAKQEQPKQAQQDNADSTTSRVKRFLSRATSFGRHSDDDIASGPTTKGFHSANNNYMNYTEPVAEETDGDNIGSSLQKYCRAILGEGSSSTINCDPTTTKSRSSNNKVRNFNSGNDQTHADFVPMNMNFIFRNGKIALFEFTQPYAIRTRESQLGRYDYSKIIDIRRNGDEFIISILTVLDKLIKVVV